MGEHISVLLNESIEALNIRDGGVYVDLTLGRGGHSSEILKRIPNGHLYCFDVDEEAIEESRGRLQGIGSNFDIIHSNFRFLKERLLERGITSVDGILMDLGVSSPQFDEAERGFSYRNDGPLDMRMETSNSLTAAEIVNTWSLENLLRIFRTYGEDADYYVIAKAICRQREVSPIETTSQLVEIIKEAKPKKSLLKKGHPAKQTFQALRIAVNDEMGALEDCLKDAPLLLKPSGVLAVISFQSLEDRMVKNRFRELSEIEGSREDFGLLPEQIPQPDYELVFKKPVSPSKDEEEVNRRSKSAKLRGLRKKGDAKQ